MRRKISLADIKRTKDKATSSSMGLHSFRIPTTNTAYYSDKDAVGAPNEEPIFYIGVITGINNQYYLTPIDDFKRVLEIAKNNSVELEKAYSKAATKEEVIANLMQKGRENPKEYQQGANLHIIACHQNIKSIPNENELKEMMDKELRKLSNQGEEIDEDDFPELISKLEKKYALDQIRERLDRVVINELANQNSLKK